MSDVAGGRVLGHRYRLERPLGSGGGGTTFLAWDQARAARVALKLLRASSPDLLAALRTEFATLRGVLHPGLVRVDDFGLVAGLEGRAEAFYTADFIDGPTLDRFAEGKRWEDVAPPLAGALEALGFLHRLGVRHGDVKPENILVTDEGRRGVLIDLGCARPLAERAPALVSGSPGFLAPELFGGGGVDARADLFAFGVTLERLGAQVSLPPNAVNLARRLQRPDPAERPGDVAEILLALGLPARSLEPGVRSAPRLLERDGELARFDEALAHLRAREPSPRALFVTGPPGIGRSRLLDEMRWRAQLGGDVVEGFARRPAAVSSMLSRATEGAALSPGLGAAVEARARLLERGTPVVLVLDDADALAPDQADLFRALARSLEPSDPILLVASSPSLDDLAPGAPELALAPLSASAIVEWSQGSLAPARAESALRLTGGFPSQIRALLALVSSGHVAEDELWGLSDAAQLDGRRLASFERLSPEERRALALLAALEGTTDDVAPPEILARLTALGWVTREGSGLRLARAAEAPSLLVALGPDRARLHAEVADRLAASIARSGASSREASQLVRNLWLGGRDAEAARALEEHQALAVAEPDAWLRAARLTAERAGDHPSLGRAADILVAAGKTGEALRILARLLRRASSPADRDDLRARAAAAYVKAGDALRALSLVARVSAGSPHRPRALDLASRAHIKLGAFTTALEAAREGIALAPRSSDDLTADLHDDLGVAASYLGDVAAARHHLGLAASLHAERGRARAQARSGIYRALAEYRAGDAAAAARGYREALALAESSGAADLVANAALNLGTAAHQLGDLGEALSSYERGLAMAIALGRASTEVTLRGNLAKLLADVGAGARAEEAARRAEARADSLGFGVLAGAAAASLGEALLLRRDLDGARGAFERARDRLSAASASREVAEVDLHLADVALAAADLAKGERALEAAGATAASLSAADLTARVTATRARYRAERRRGSEAVPLFEAALSLARRAGQRSLEAEIEARLADVLATLGASVRARRHQESACEAWERSAESLPPDLAEAFWEHPLRARRREALLRAGDADHTARERKLERLLDINKKLNSSLEPAQVLAWTLDHALELTGAERGFVLLAGPDQTLTVDVVRNLDPSATDLSFSRGIAERVVASGEPVVTVDATGDERFSGSASVHAMRLKSVVSAPIRAPAGVLGALYLDHRFQRGLFGPHDVSLLLAFADQAAVALTNARLHEELSRRTRELVEERRRIEELVRGQGERILELTEEVRSKQQALELRYEYGKLVGRSAGMRALLRTLDRVIDTPATVLIEGESGTGKELVARAIHFNGPRRQGPFAALNCGALPEALLEAELFGHARGAFTGAVRDRDGLLVTASGGTLFLDELGEMPPAMQVKLLRVLQEREVQPLGSPRPRPFDARVVCATNRRLRDEVAAGRFREDLYYRVGVVEVRVPPLRERPEDLPEIAARILAEAARSLTRPPATLSPKALRALLAHPWPGNVRQLENVLTKALLLAEGAVLGPEDLELDPPRSLPPAGLPTDRASFERDEAARIVAVLNACRWNVKEACAALGIPRATLYRKLKRHGIGRPVS